VAVLNGDVLVVNAGSTSVKLTVLDAREASRSIEDVAGAGTVAAVGHRIVHGGARFTAPTRIDDAVLVELDAVCELAPLHNGPALALVRELTEKLPDVPHVAVFDTAFHRTMAERARTYAIPLRFRERGIERFGFHGLSVAWAAEQVSVSRLVVCHLGGGCSVTAVADGRSIDTTMGFTPLEGVPMGTRAGSVDPGALLYLLRHGVSPHELDVALERESGLVGLAGTSDVGKLIAADTASARAALDLFSYRVAQAVGAMTIALGGIDALVFTGGIGEHAAPVRDAICDLLTSAGIDPRVEVVHAREDVMVARGVRELLVSHS
jgi:acetate kinase